MSSVIQLLERMGKESTLVDSKSEFLEAINSSDLSRELKKALINKDTEALINNLGICPDIVCALFPAEEENEDEGAEEKPSEEVHL